MSKEILVATKDVVVGSVEESKKLTKEDGSAVRVITCEVDGSVYVESLKEAGLDIKTVKALQKHDSEYLVKLQKEAAAAGAQILKENPEADRVLFVAPYQGDKVTRASSRADVEIIRSKKSFNPLTKEVTYGPAIGMSVVNKFQKNGAEDKKEILALLQDRLASN